MHKNKIDKTFFGIVIALVVLGANTYALDLG